MHRLAALALVAVLVVLAGSALAQTRTPWQMHDGLEVTAENPNGLIQFNCSPAQHGDTCEYAVAIVPPAGDPGWGPAPNGEIIDFSISSRVCGAPVTCMQYGDFTYFQTFVDIPANVIVSTFTIDFSGMDDGSRVSIFNSTHPAGLVVPGNYVFLGGSGTTNLKDYVVAGEVNRVVITQVDDCCSENNLRSAVVVLNGAQVSTNAPPACSAGGPYSAGAGVTQLALDGSASSDPDGTALAYAWTSDCPGVAFDDSARAQPVLAITPPDQDVDCHVVLTVSDGQAASSCTTSVHIAAAVANQPPDCSQAAASRVQLWPPDHTFRSITILGVTDPDGDPVTVHVTGITQDEPVEGIADGDAAPDGRIEEGQASLRAERAGAPKVPGNGRVYVVRFTADDGRGGTCDGSVSVCVPHDMGHATCQDDGQRYVSTDADDKMDGVSTSRVSLRVAPLAPTSAQVLYGLPADGPVNLSVYDVVGRRVATIEDGNLAMGVYSRVWEMKDLPRGLYFVRLHAGQASVTRRVLRLQ